MIPGTGWIGLATVLLTAALAALPAERAAAQATTTAPATRPATAQAISYTTEARSEIMRLPPAPLAPRTAEDLAAVQTRVEAIVKEAVPATVAIIINTRGGTAEGSGVIVSRDGYVLTAGHVSGTPGTYVRLRLADGRTVNGRSRGNNRTIDSGMIKIETPGEYPFVPLGTTTRLIPGQWIVAMGHPGGLQEGRPPVVRLGRVLARQDAHGFVQTDCEIIMGDSGGPVFDLDGRLVAINSRIGAETDDNLHTPVDASVDGWERLAAGQQWGGPTTMVAQPSGGARLGVSAANGALGVSVNGIAAGTPAEDSGLKVGDIITQADDTPVKSLDDLASVVGRRKAGDLITLRVLREGRTRQVSFKLAARTGR